MDNSTAPYQPLRGNAYRKQFRQGHVYEAPIFYAQPQMIVARPLHDAASASGALPANILLQPADLFAHAPFPHLRLAADEEFLVVKAKRRPGIVISADSINLASDMVLVVPLYSADNYKPEFVQRVQEAEYPGFLYLAADATLGRKPSIARFDHLQSVSKSQLRPKPLAVTPEMLRQLFETLDRFIGQQF